MISASVGRLRIEIVITTLSYMLDNQDSFSEKTGHLVYVTSTPSLPFVE